MRSRVLLPRRNPSLVAQKRLPTNSQLSSRNRTLLSVDRGDHHGRKEHSSIWHLSKQSDRRVSSRSASIRGFFARRHFGADGRQRGVEGFCGGKEHQSS